MAGAGKGSTASEREGRVSGVVARWIDQHGVDGRVLVVDDEDGAIVAAVRRAGATATRWSRFSRGSQRASALPPAGPVDHVILRLPRDWAGFELQLHAVLDRLVAGGRLWVVGGNDEGIKSVPRRMAGLLGDVETLWIKQRVRILEAIRPDSLDLRPALAAWKEQVQLDLPGVGPRTLVSYPGLFAHGRLDEGSAMLLAHLPEIAPGSRVLDFGCGAGALSVAVHARQAAAQLFLCDVDALAVEAARDNLPTAQVFLGDGWSAIELGARFDLVLSNPPLHQGQARTLELLRSFISQAPLRLTKGGSVVLVTWRTARADRLLAEHFARVKVLAEDTRFQVLQAS